MPPGLSRDHTNAEAALSLPWAEVTFRWLQVSLPDATLPLHSFLIWLPVRALLVHRGNCWHCLTETERTGSGSAASAIALILETAWGVGLPSFSYSHNVS